MAKPAVRFKGFNDDWEKQNVKNTFVILQNNTISRAALSSNGIAKNIHYGDILIKFGEYLNISIEKLSMIADDSIVTKYKSSFLKNGDVIIADTAEDETVGKCTEITGLNNEIVISGLHTIPYRPKFNFAPKYLGYYMNSDSYHNQLLPLIQGIKVSSVSKSALQETIIKYPSSLDEQQKIGAFFTTLDKLITLSQRKYDKLVNIKKVMLTKMFPRDSAKVPELRFKGFTGDWEEHKLREISTIIDPHPSHRAPKEVKIGIPFIGIGDINEFGKINYSSVRIVDPSIYDEHCKRYDLNIPSIGIGRVASLGKVIRLRNDIGKYAVSPTMSIIQFHNTIKLDYCFAYMTTPMFQNQFSSQSNGSTRLSVGIQDLRELNITLPTNKAEQQKIGEFSTTLDNLIALHQQKLEKLKNIKKACLEKMFV